uniref:Uncharacterized protein n=1 Tax=Macaca fascicularis TaxID=9541 RepID=Q9GMQ5_MACFA|nr:hypothetical protein [Macaca fascicularis]
MLSLDSPTQPLTIALRSLLIRPIRSLLMRPILQVRKLRLRVNLVQYHPGIWWQKLKIIFSDPDIPFPYYPSFSTYQNICSLFLLSQGSPRLILCLISQSLILVLGVGNGRANRTEAGVALTTPAASEYPFCIFFPKVK